MKLAKNLAKVTYCKSPDGNERQVILDKSSDGRHTVLYGDKVDGQWTYPSPCMEFFETLDQAEAMVAFLTN